MKNISAPANAPCKIGAIACIATSYPTFPDDLTKIASFLSDGR